MKPYQLLPFRFRDFRNENMLLVNEAGEFLFTSKKEFSDMISYRLDTKSEIFLDLKSKHFLTDTEIEQVIKMLATKYRTKKSFLYDFTSLHMLVPTLRCNSKCKYCQVSSKSEEAVKFDMNESTARKIVDLIFMTPAPAIKIEFQGGEPLLNLEIVKYVIDYAEQCNSKKCKKLEFVICTNLTLITDEILEYLRNHKVYISTSLDGPNNLHNMNRPFRNGQASYDVVIKNMEKVREYLGEDSVSALMTTTKESLKCLSDIIDEYVLQGFDSIFIRSLNPYGLARKDMDSVGYDIEDFINTYKEALNHIININLNGTFFVECYAALLLARILTPFSTGFVDLQSPSGVAICGVIYDYNGNVYVSDEARMLSYDGDTTFLMGNVHKNSYHELFHSEKVISLINKSCLECLPVCSYCAYQSYCGVDPVRNYAEQKDIIGNRMISSVCKKNMAIFQYLLQLIKENDKPTMNVLWSWITRRQIFNKNKVVNESN